MQITTKIAKDCKVRYETSALLANKNTGSGPDLYAAVIFKKGSKTVTVKPIGYYKKTKKGNFKIVKKKHLKLKKGTTYRMNIPTLFEVTSDYVTIK